MYLTWSYWWFNCHLNKSYMQKFIFLSVSFNFWCFCVGINVNCYKEIVCAMVLIVKLDNNYILERLNYFFRTKLKKLSKFWSLNYIISNFTIKMKILSVISFLEVLGKKKKKKKKSSLFFYREKTLYGTLAFPYHYYNQHC